MNTRDIIRQKIYHLHAIANQVPVTRDALSQGRLCLALSAFYSGRYLEDEKLTATGHQLLEEIFTNIQTGKQNNFTTQSFLSGMTGLTAVVNHLTKYSFVAFDMSSLSDIDASIYQWADSQIDGDNIDFLYGAMGAIAYFSQRLPDPTIQSYLEALLHKLQLKSADNNGSYLLVNQFYIKAGEQEEGQVHFGIAHGISSMLLVFLDLIKMGFSISLQPTIDQIIQYNEQHCHDDHHAFIGSINHRSNEILYQGRIGWCFSELNTFHVLLKAAQVLQVPAYQTFGYRKLENIVGKNTIQSTRADEPFLCHGAAGICQYYAYLHQLTGHPAFLDAHQLWTQHTLDQLNNITDDYWTSREYELKHHVHALLSGVPGIILSLLTAYDNKAKNWSELILLN
ncbi:MAG: hypothetical protein JO154_05525 [Chitinophaga sp.]|uniref:lanthionine synthetase LanC family protein n=1 Tax=Chitinophaga sp. TaxID=1869181 RepID=UPI0025BB73FD|nr:lanthionine synthetase LanC family protein [Chitinophaga sp.]MBV8252048.1 hypothetical protein [Chitinophaga sp.]